MTGSGDRPGEGFEEFEEDLLDAAEGEGFQPDREQLADIAYLSWSGEGVVTASDIEDMARREDMDISFYEASYGMDFIMEQGLVDGEGLEYDLGESQQFRDPDPGLFDRMIAPFVGEAFVEDAQRAFSLVHELQRSYDREPDTAEDHGEEPGRGYISPWNGEELDADDRIDSGPEYEPGEI